VAEASDSAWAEDGVGPARALYHCKVMVTTAMSICARHTVAWVPGTDFIKERLKNGVLTRDFIILSLRLPKLGIGLLGLNLFGIALSLAGRELTLADKHSGVTFCCLASRATCWTSNVT
jgi:hypothetical protein